MRHIRLILWGLLCAFWVNCVLANGINPPQPRDAITVKATCTTRAQPNVIEIFRARITGGEASVSLHLRIAGVVEETSLANIASIKFASSKVGNDGYLAAKIVRRDAEKDESASVQVRAGKTDVALLGFGNTGATVKVRLSDCAVVDFSTSPMSSETPDRPISGK